MNEPFHYHDGGLELRGVLERPVQPNGRAVLVVHEAPGLGDNARRRTRMLADLGYLALAADLYGGGRTFSGTEAMDGLRADTAAFRRRVRAGLDALLGLDGVDPARTAAIGYCFGGMAVLELARSGTALGAVVSFHGLLGSAQPAKPGQIAAKLLACTGALDPLAPPADIAAFQREMDDAGADWQLIVYGRALHSFTNRNVAGGADPRMDYHPSADRQSWAAALLFLDEALGG
ncbi:MAG TPA: dienelactone hydrolase family protein [Allosphingosinicella sp.]|jgi:dienelactone hydrolase